MCYRFLSELLITFSRIGDKMSTSQILGVRMFCLALGWAFGALIFGTDAEWLWGTKSFIWCGFAGGTIGIMLTSK